MKWLIILLSFFLVSGIAEGQKLAIHKEDISPDGIKKIGGIGYFHDEIFLMLQSNLLFRGKELEASEAVAISQKYPVWDIYRYLPDSGTIENKARQWKTTGASPNGFCIIDEETVLFINDKSQVDSNNKELKNALKKVLNPKATYADPYSDGTGNRIWFSSDMPGGEGGMDLWYVEKSGEEWGAPVNAGKKINSPGNDISPSVWNDSILVLSSNREGISYDLFFFSLGNGEMLHREETPASNEFFSLIPKKGLLLFLSSEGTNTRLWKAGLSAARTPDLEIIETKKIEKAAELPAPETDLSLKIHDRKPEESLNFQMTNYFGLARYDLTPYMRDSLTRLAQTLKRTPGLNILICGQASPDGPDDLNMMLSCYRANEAYNWLIEQKIDPSRIFRVYGGEYLFNDTLRARNFSIFTLVNPDLPAQIALYPLAPGEREEEVAVRFGINPDNMEFHRYQLNKYLPLGNKKLMLVPVNALYLAKTGQTAAEIARQYNIPPARLKQMNRVGDAPLTEDKVLFIVY